MSVTSLKACQFLTVAEIAELLKLNPMTIRNWIDAGELAAVRVGKRRVRVRQSALDAFLEAGSTSTPDDKSLPAEEVDEGSVTAWTTFGAAMADATATLESADRVELVGVLERLTQATQALVDSLTADAAPRRQAAAREPARHEESPGFGAVRHALREHDAD